MVQMPSLVSSEMDNLIDSCELLHSPFGFLTDETLSVAFEIFPIFDPLWPESAPNLEALPIDRFPVRFALAGLVHLVGVSMQIFCNGSRPVRRCQGAMVEHVPTIASLPRAFSSRFSFSDWDLFTLQRSRQEWEIFKRWRTAVGVMAEVRPLEIGNILKVKKGVDFGKRHFLRRSPFPKVPLPAETLASIMMQSRTRHDTIDIILGSSDGDAHDTAEDHQGSDVTFAITDVRRSGERAYSQIVFGTLGDSAARLCLKLYDERLFPADEADDDDDIRARDPSERLNNLPFAIDLAGAEEAAYDRLSDLQGSLLPHYYGIHQVSNVFDTQLHPY